MNSDDIKRKIRSLYALAADKGASEDEAATAMRMAAGLMMKYGISQDQLGVKKPEAKKGSRLNARFEKYQIIVANAAAYLHGCRCIVYGGGAAGLCFVGRDENLDAAQATMIYLTQQLERLYKKSLPKGLSQKERSEYRKTFKWACALRVESRIFDLVKSMQTDNLIAQQTTGSTALVVKSHFDNLLSEADKAVGNLPAMKLKAKFGSGSLDGHSAGDKVKLRQEVSNA